MELQTWLNLLVLVGFAIAAGITNWLILYTRKEVNEKEQDRLRRNAAAILTGIAMFAFQLPILLQSSAIDIEFISEGNLGIILVEFLGSTGAGTIGLKLYNTYKPAGAPELKLEDINVVNIQKGIATMTGLLDLLKKKEATQQQINETMALLQQFATIAKQSATHAQPEPAVLPPNVQVTTVKKP